MLRRMAVVRSMVVRIVLFIVVLIYILAKVIFIRENPAWLCYFFEG